MIQLFSTYGSIFIYWIITCIHSVGTRSQIRALSRRGHNEASVSRVCCNFAQVCCLKVYFCYSYAIFRFQCHCLCEGAMGLRLTRQTLGRRVWVRDLMGPMFCVLQRLITLTVPLFTQEYKRVWLYCLGILMKCRKVTFDGLATHPGRLGKLVVTLYS